MMQNWFHPRSSERTRLCPGSKTKTVRSCLATLLPCLWMFYFLLLLLLLFSASLLPVPFTSHFLSPAPLLPPSNLSLYPILSSSPFRMIACIIHLLPFLHLFFWLLTPFPQILSPFHHVTPPTPIHRAPYCSLKNDWAADLKPPF